MRYPWSLAQMTLFPEYFDPLIRAGLILQDKQRLYQVIKPYQTISNHIKPYQTISNHIKPYQTKQWFWLDMIDPSKNVRNNLKASVSGPKSDHLSPELHPLRRMWSPGFVAMVASLTSAWWSAMGLWAGGSLPRRSVSFRIGWSIRYSISITIPLNRYVL